MARVGTTSVLIGEAAGYPLRHPGRTSVPSAATAGAERRSWSSVSGGTTTLTRLVGLPRAVSGATMCVALLALTLTAGNELRGGARILGTIGSGPLSLMHRRDDASPRSSMDDA